VGDEIVVEESDVSQDVPVAAVRRQLSLSQRESPKKGIFDRLLKC